MLIRKTRSTHRHKAQEYDRAQYQVMLKHEAVRVNPNRRTSKHMNPTLVQKVDEELERQAGNTSF